MLTVTDPPLRGSERARNRIVGADCGLSPALPLLYLRRVRSYLRRVRSSTPPPAAPSSARPPRPRTAPGALAAIFAVVLVAAAPVAAEPGASVVFGDVASSLLGHPVASLRGFAIENGGAKQIPFQVDVRAENDRWVLDRGSDVDPDDQPGTFDRNDALVFANRHLGARGDTDVLPEGAAHWVELRVGSESSPLGFVYVGVFPPAETAAGPQAPVRYDSKTDEAHGERYAIRFDDVLPRHVAFVDSLGELGESFVTATRVKGNARLLGGMVAFERSDADVSERIEGWRNGPVRSLRRGRYLVPLPLGFDASGRVDFFFYEDFVEIAGMLRLKVPPWVAGANGAMTGYVELPAKEAARAMFAASAESGGAEDGRRWAALILEDGRTLVMVVRLGGSLDKMEKRFYLTDPPDARGGSVFGFELSEANRLDAGEHPFAVVATFLRDPSEREIQETARRLLDPPPVTARVLSAGSS